MIPRQLPGRQQNSQESASSQIQDGGDWRTEIQAALSHCDVAFLLVSRHFLTSTFVLDEQIGEILKRRISDGLVVYPTLLNNCSWKAIDWLQAMNLRPIDGRALDTMNVPTRNQVMVAITEEISDLLDSNMSKNNEEMYRQALHKDEIGDGHLAKGELVNALQSYQDSLAIKEHLVVTDPSNTEWQQGLAVSHNRIGDVQVGQGMLDDALQSFRATLAIKEHLVVTGPSNTEWQQGLAVSHDKIGDVQVAQGDLAGALEAYGDSLAIAERLAAADPGHAGWQRDLSASHNRVGDVRRDQGYLAGALEAYEDSLAIRERLAAADPGHAGWQRDLIMSRWRFADLAERRNASEEALDHWRAALVIAKELEGSDRLAPKDAHVVETIEQRINALIAPAAGTDG